MAFTIIQQHLTEKKDTPNSLLSVSVDGSQYESRTCPTTEMKNKVQNYC